MCELRRGAKNLGLPLLAFAIVSFGPLRMCAQGTLPPTSPTAITPSQLPSANPSVSAHAGSHGSMNLLWDGHTLQVNANDVGLNALLRNIATRTGTRLSGAVPEDRIFGTYGPGPLTDVLSELLDGLPVNVLFVDHSGNKPAELTLTARLGGPVAPAPQTPQESDQVADQPSGPAFSRPNGGPAAGRGDPPSRALADPQNPSSQAPGADASATADAASASGTTPSSPNGVKTPEEIFDQLQRLRATANSTTH